MEVCIVKPDRIFFKEEAEEQFLQQVLDISEFLKNTHHL